MSELPSRSWWTTIPGVLTGVAAILTALAGLLAALVQAGIVAVDRTRLTADYPAPQAAPSAAPQAGLQSAPPTASTSPTPPAATRPPSGLGQPLDLDSFKVQVLSAQRSASASGGMQVRVVYRVTAGGRDVNKRFSEVIRIVADGVPRAVLVTRFSHSGQEVPFLSVHPETAVDLVSEFNIPNVTDDLVVRFSDGLRGPVAEVRLPPA